MGSGHDPGRREPEQVGGRPRRQRTDRVAALRLELLEHPRLRGGPRDDDGAVLEDRQLRLCAEAEPLLSRDHGEVEDLAGLRRGADVAEVPHARTHGALVPLDHRDAEPGAHGVQGVRQPDDPCSDDDEVGSALHHEP